MALSSLICCIAVIPGRGRSLVGHAALWSDFVVLSPGSGGIA